MYYVCMYVFYLFIYSVIALTLALFVTSNKFESVSSSTFNCCLSLSLLNNTNMCCITIERSYSVNVNVNVPMHETLIKRSLTSHKSAVSAARHMHGEINVFST